MLAATGTAPLFAIRPCTSFCSVVLMKSYASSLFFAFFGTTHRLPPEPGTSLLPGHRKVSHWNFLISDSKVPYHQLPETIIGFLPDSKLLPMSVDFRLTESLAR